MTMRFLTIIIAAFFFATMACEKDNSLMLNEVPAMAIETFDTLYPDATNVIWERYYNQFHVSFTNNAHNSVAKFTAGGDWLITQTPLVYSDIPRPIIDSLRASIFRNWLISEQMRNVRLNMDICIGY